MKTWIIVAAFMVVAIAIAGIVAVKAVSSEVPSASGVKASAGSVGCSGCGGSCSQDKNCGLATCDGANGGTCNCGKK